MKLLKELLGEVKGEVLFREAVEEVLRYHGADQDKAKEVAIVVTDLVCEEDSSDRAPEVMMSIGSASACYLQIH